MNAIHPAAAAHLLAAPVNDNTPWVGPGLLGFIIVVIIGLATWFLGRSMVKQLRKLDNGPAEQEQADTPKDERAAAAGPQPDPKLNGAH